MARIWRGHLNYHGEVHVMDTTADSAGKAKSNFMARLAGKLKIRIPIVSMYFGQNPTAIRIEEKR